MAEKPEIEVKWALDGAGHGLLARRLAADHGPGRSLAQDNRFFDTGDGRLLAAGMNLRLRREDGRLVVTAKRRAAAAEADHQHHLEWEVEIPGWDGDPATLPRPGWLDETRAGGLLRAQGGFANQRLEWVLEGELVCLDRTDLGVRVDHELEIESQDPLATRAAWDRRLAGWGIAARPQRLTKFARWRALAVEVEARTAD